ncbi:MAG TPA: arginase family protein [Streptosporangiaceae bacterium]
MSDWVLIGVPTSAGAHHAGQDLAPAALRAAGLLDRLQARGVPVSDAGDLPGSVFAVDAGHPRYRNVGAVVSVARRVADFVASQPEQGPRLLVVGGDCTITLGVVAGMRRRHPGVGLAYVDGDADLSAGRPDDSGILDSTGIAHLVGLATSELATFGGPAPLLAPSRLALVGCDPREVGEPEREYIAGHAISYAEAAELSADPEGVARRALAHLRPGPAAPVIVHFDVDMIDSGYLPLGNYPHYGTGVRLADAVRCLRILTAHAACTALVLTEVNPTHDPGGELLAEYADAIANVLS